MKKPMTYLELAKIAMRTDDATVADEALWCRTPFPFGGSTKELYKMMDGFRRACANNLRLCDFCHRKARLNEWTCALCGDALK